MNKTADISGHGRILKKVPVLRTSRRHDDMIPRSDDRGYFLSAPTGLNTPIYPLDTRRPIREQKQVRVRHSNCNPATASVNFLVPRFSTFKHATMPTRRLSTRWPIWQSSILLAAYAAMLGLPFALGFWKILPAWSVLLTLIPCILVCLIVYRFFISGFHSREVIGLISAIGDSTSKDDARSLLVPQLEIWRTSLVSRATRPELTISQVGLATSQQAVSWNQIRRVIPVYKRVELGDALEVVTTDVNEFAKELTNLAVQGVSCSFKKTAKAPIALRVEFVDRFRHLDIDVESLDVHPNFICDLLRVCATKLSRSELAEFEFVEPEPLEAFFKRISGTSNDGESDSGQNKSDA